MIKSKTCPKCGSKQIAGPHSVVGGDYVRVNLTGFSTATLKAFTCSECGYTEFYSDKMGLQNIRSKGKFTLNPRMGVSRVPRRCLSCGAKTRPGSSYCHECAAKFN